MIRPGRRQARSTRRHVFRRWARASRARHVPAAPPSRHNGTTTRRSCGRWQIARELAPRRRAAQARSKRTYIAEPARCGTPVSLSAAGGPPIAPLPRHHRIRAHHLRTCNRARRNACPFRLVRRLRCSRSRILVEGSRVSLVIGARGGVGARGVMLESTTGRKDGSRTWSNQREERRIRGRNRRITALVSRLELAATQANARPPPAFLSRVARHPESRALRRNAQTSVAGWWGGGGPAWPARASASATSTWGTDAGRPRGPIPLALWGLARSFIQPVHSHGTPRQYAAWAGESHSRVLVIEVHRAPWMHARAGDGRRGA